MPKGGTNLWVRLPDGRDDVALADRAAAAGVLVTPSRPFHAAEPAAGHVRLTYSGTALVAELDEGVRRLASAVRAMS